MSTLISPSSPAWRSRPLVTAKFLASISAAAGITSFWVKSIAVLAICRCSSVRSSGVNTSCGSRSSVRKLPPLTRFAIICMLLVAICISSVQILEDSRGPHAASHAHRHNSILGAPTYHLLKQSGGEFGPRASQWVPQCNRAAVHVDALRRQPQRPDHGQRLAREGFVEFNKLDLVQVQARQFQRLGYGVHRTDPRSEEHTSELQ